MTSLLSSNSIQAAPVETDVLGNLILDDLKIILKAKFTDISADIEQFLTHVVKELFRYLFLLANDAHLLTIAVSPSFLVDEALHALLLDPVLYFKVCDAILNHRGYNKDSHPIRVLPHNPLGGNDVDARQARYENTLSLYKATFNQDPPATFWPVVTTADSAHSDVLVPFVPTPEGEQTISVKVQTLSGLVYPVSNIGSTTETVLNLKRRVAAQEGLPETQQRLVFGGRQVENEEVLSALGVTDGSVLHLILHLRC